MGYWEGSINFWGEFVEKAGNQLGNRKTGRLQGRVSPPDTYTDGIVEGFLKESRE